MVNEKDRRSKRLSFSLNKVVSEVELQGELYLSRVLRSGDDTVACIWFCEVRVIEQIQEVRPEL